MIVKSQIALAQISERT